MVYDTLLLIGIWMITLFFMVVAHDGTAVAGLRVQAILFLEMFAFFALFWRRDGQTVGMMAWRMRIVSIRGGRLSLAQIILRFLGGLLAAAPLGLGYLWMLVDPDRRTWGDMLSDSRVVVEPKGQRGTARSTN